MSHPAPTTLSKVMDSARTGSVAITSADARAVYQELRAIARALFKAEDPNLTLQPTALVNEAYLRLYGGATPSFNDRKHLMNAFRIVMKRILIDRSRAASSLKRGGDHQRLGQQVADEIGVIDAPIVREFAAEQIQRVSETIDRLRTDNPDHADVVEYKFYCNLTEPEIAEIMGIGEATVRRHWRFARSWLHTELQAAGDGGDGA
jgi:RNA polymerase sigma factor (TIGR02999 family)